MNNTGKNIIALLAGVSAGLVAGILLAPDKGSETRRKILESSRKLKAESMDTISELTEKLNELTHMGNGHEHSRSS